MQEVRTGYRHGCAELALEGEPRPQYAAGVPMMARYQAKAAELGIGASTVRRWVMQAQDGPAGLVTERSARLALDRADPRWLDAARQVITGHVPPQPPGPPAYPGRDRAAARGAARAWGGAGAVAVDGV